MATLTFDVAAFRLAFPAYAGTACYPDEMLQAYWDTAILYISNDESYALSGATLMRCLDLMTAHLAALSDIAKKGQVPGLVEQAMIDKIKVTISLPPVKSQWQWWLSLTPYGQQLFALLQVQSVGGFLIGGLPETAGFRKIGGVF